MKKYLLLSFLTILLTVFVAGESKAQVRSFASIYGLASDTVTNGATQYLQIYNPGEKTSTTVWVAVTKISGTVGGTITLQGSIDGVTYKALYAIESVTALAAFTATDATNTYHWRLHYNPLPYYRVSWTGAGTMAASFTAKLLSR